ncbi:hypothetical protein [Microcoleus sp. N3A4]
MLFLSVSCFLREFLPPGLIPNPGKATPFMIRRLKPFNLKLKCGEAPIV